MDRCELPRRRTVGAILTLWAAHQFGRASQRDRSTSTTAGLAEICRTSPTHNGTIDWRSIDTQSAAMRRWRQLWRRRLFRDVTSSSSSSSDEQCIIAIWLKIAESARPTERRWNYRLSDDSLLQDARHILPVSSPLWRPHKATVAGLRCPITASLQQAMPSYFAYCWR